MDRSGRPILSDFGIAKVLASTQMNLTYPGAGVGTPEYMSPEQCQGGPIDNRADIYALGIMLFEAMTGRTPFRGENYPALAHSHIYEPPPPPRSINPNIPPAIEHVILTAIMKNPTQRYQKASDMAEALQHSLLMNPPALNYRPARAVTTTPTVQKNTPPQAFFACRVCQHLNKGQDSFCTRCGNVTNQCPFCGEKNPAKNQFCRKCGNRLF